MGHPQSVDVLPRLLNSAAAPRSRAQQPKKRRTRLSHARACHPPGCCSFDRAMPRLAVLRHSAALILTLAPAAAPSSQSAAPPSQHELNIVARLKPSNVMIAEGHQPKIRLDVATADDASDPRREVYDLWSAPEVLRGGAHTSASDSYCYGLILYEIFSGEEIFGRQIRNMARPCGRSTTPLLCRECSTAPSAPQASARRCCRVLPCAERQTQHRVMRMGLNPPWSKPETFGSEGAACCGSSSFLCLSLHSAAATDAGEHPSRRRAV